MMKLRKLFLSLLISGVTLGSANAQQPIMDRAPATNASASRNVSRHIGDDAAVAQSDVQSPYQTEQHESGPKPQQPASQQSAAQPRAVQPIAPNQNYQQQQYIAPTTMSYQPQCGSGACGQSYDNGYEGGGRRVSGFRDECYSEPNMWFDAETLLWWGQKRNVPPLLTTAAAGVLPVAGAPGVTNAVGGIEGMSSGLLPGYRLSGGMYFGPERRVGVSGRMFGIYRNNVTTTRSDDGTNQSIGIPFFNTLIGQPDAYLVAFDNGAPVASGSASVNSRLELFGADQSLRLLVSDSNDHKIDLLGGYSYLRLKDSLGITTTSTDTLTGNLIPDGTVFQTNDQFSALNTFHGAHLGLQSTVRRSRVSLSTLSKVSFGNMQETGSISGSTSVGLPPAASTVSAGGIYSQQSNIGNFSRDTFAFIPELGVKGGLAIRQNVQLTAGYTFLYVSKVALAGNQIDSNIDLSQAQGGPAALQPGFNYREGSMWFQGLDLGLNFTF